MSDFSRDQRSTSLSRSLGIAMMCAVPLVRTVTCGGSERNNWSELLVDLGIANGARLDKAVTVSQVKLLELPPTIWDED